MILVPYDQFVAPGLMAASAMNGAVFDSTMNVFFKIKVSKTYDAVLTTPMTAGDVALGEITFAVLRGALYSTAFMVTMWALGMVQSPWIVMAVPACRPDRVRVRIDRHGSHHLHAQLGGLRIRPRC